MVDCDSTLVSPLSSRCPSPQSHRFRALSRPRSSYFRAHQQPPPTSVPFACEPKRLSISTLTQKLHDHTLQTPNGERMPERGSLGHDGSRVSNRYSRYVLTPPETDHDEDGLNDSSPSLCSSHSPTSLPADFPLLDCTEPPSLSRRQSQTVPDHLNVRMQRQHISQLQCNNEDIDAIRRTVLAEDSFPDISGEDDCHPSSLPLQAAPRRRAVTLHRSRFGPPESLGETRGRRRSLSGAAQPQRIEKSHHQSSSFGGREYSKRGEHLRRKSVVSAALASVVEWS